MAAKSHPVRSLQELCEKKLCDLFLQSDTAEDYFASLAPRIQMLLFGSLRAEHARLHTMKTTLCKMPRVDLQLYLSTSANESDVLEPDADREFHQNHWKYESFFFPHPEEEFDQNLEYRWNNGGAQWDTSELRRESGDIKFKSCLNHWFSGGCKRLKVSLSERISSQLLLYRITATFGMPPVLQTYGHAYRWVVSLHHKDCVSWFNIGECKGRPWVYFDGSDLASDDALRLLDYLVGPNFEHSPRISQ
jgi:hypothetical protein